MERQIRGSVKRLAESFGRGLALDHQLEQVLSADEHRGNGQGPGQSEAGSGEFARAEGLEEPDQGSGRGLHSWPYLKRYEIWRPTVKLTSGSAWKDSSH